MSLFGYLAVFVFSSPSPFCPQYLHFINYPLAGHMIHVSLRFSHETFDAPSVFAIDHDLLTLAVVGVTYLEDAHL